MKLSLLKGYAVQSLSVSQRILESYDDLTRGERRIADLLLGDPDVLVLKSATEISAQVGVSQATTFLPTMAATTVAPTDFETEASWKTVSASTGAPPVSRTPNPLA